MLNPHFILNPLRQQNPHLPFFALPTLFFQSHVHILKHWYDGDSLPSISSDNFEDDIEEIYVSGSSFRSDACHLVRRLLGLWESLCLGEY